MGPRVDFEKHGESFKKNATDADWWGYGDGGFRRENLQGPKRKTRISCCWTRCCGVDMAGVSVDDGDTVAGLNATTLKRKTKRGSWPTTSVRGASAEEGRSARD